MVGRCFCALTIAAYLLVGAIISTAAQPSDDRPLVLYDFAASEGRVIKDRSAVQPELDLVIDREEGVERSSDGLEIRAKAAIRSGQPATKIIDAVRRNGELTVEVWVRPANTTQDGPARILTLSRDTSHRNFTLGQDGRRFDFRLRTTKTGSNGLPSLSSPNGDARTDWAHVVYTRSKSGQARLFVDGELRAQKQVSGSVSNWDRSYRLAIGDELSGGRDWRGAVRLAAVYSRALSAEEVRRHFQAGWKGTAQELAEDRLTVQSLAAKRFERDIAPLLARRCLECHRAGSTKGGLDLSRKKTAFAGGDSGRAIEPGKSAESLLWEYVASDDMPKDRPPLSTREKKLLRDWIDAGAAWTLPELKLPAEDSGPAEAAFVRRLTVDEYIETVRVAVGVDIEQEARKLLPRDLRADGFNNTAYNLNVDLQHVEAYATLARKIVERMDVAKFAARFTPGRDLSDANLRRLIAEMGRWLLRGPLDESEVRSLMQVPAAVEKEGGDFDEAAAYLLEAMLQSPRFIYRIERQHGEGSSEIGPYELASRLSYILWGGPPDEELLRAAAAGELAEEGTLRQQVRRMLDDPRAVRQSRHFISGWLNLDRLSFLRPSEKKFPDWKPELAGDMRQETLAFFHDIVWRQRRPLADLFNAQVTYATPRLARHYGLKPQGDGLARYDLSDVPSRGGLLTQGSVLTVGGDEASMVARGLFVLHQVLRGKVDDPPPCVDTTPVPTKEGLTQRGIALARIADSSCGGCHSKFEPLAFGLEKFDGLGSYHERDEHGNRLREDGDILFPGTDQTVSYKTAAQLMNLLADNDRVRETITWKATQWALGRPLTKQDAAEVTAIHRAAQKRGGTYPALMEAIVMSDLVRSRRAP